MKRFITLFILFFLTIHLHAQQGSLDKSYGNSGIVLTQGPGYGGSSYASAVQADDKVIIGGYFTDSAILTNGYHATQLILQRYNKDGSLDVTFGTKGSASLLIDTPYLGSFSPGWNAVAIQPDGSILAAASLYKEDRKLQPPYNQRGYATLARYKANGTPDSSFGTNGIVITDVNGKSAIINAMALQKDGRIVLTGQIYRSFYSNGPMLIMRYNPDGTLDKSFGGIGYVEGKDVGNISLAILIQPDGKILTGGRAGYSDSLFRVFRYLPDGTPMPRSAPTAKCLPSFLKPSTHRSTALPCWKTGAYWQAALQHRISPLPIT